MPLAEDQHPGRGVLGAGCRRGARRSRSSAEPGRRAWSVRRGCGRCPHRGFSFARRATSRVMPGPVGGRPGVRRLLVSYLPATSLRCQASSVAGVIGKMAAQRLRGMSRASAASHTRSAGRTGPGRRGGAAPRSRGGARAARHPSPGRCGISGRRGPVSGELAGRRLSSISPTNHHRAPAAGERRRSAAQSIIRAA